MIRPFTLLTIVAAAGAGLHVYNTKHAVSLLDRELRTIARDIGEAEARTQALQAEWFWATEQERLRALVQRHLALEPMQPSQFVRLAEAERRIPAPAAEDDSPPLFAPGEAAAATADSGVRTRIALLPPEAPANAATAPLPVAVAPAPPVAPPLSAPVLAAVAKAALAVAADTLPLPAPAAPELKPVGRSPVAFVTPPPPPVAAARPVEPRPAEARAPEPRPVAEAARAAAAPLRPAPLRPAAPPPPAAAAVAATPPRPPAPSATHVAATAPRAPATTQVAVAAVPRAPEGATALGSFGSTLGGSTLGGGSALGSARAALPPPVAFGSALR